MGCTQYSVIHPISHFGAMVLARDGKTNTFWPFRWFSVTVIGNHHYVAAEWGNIPFGKPLTLGSVMVLLLSAKLLWKLLTFGLLKVHDLPSPNISWVIRWSTPRLRYLSHFNISEAKFKSIISNNFCLHF